MDPQLEHTDDALAETSAERDPLTFDASDVESQLDAERAANRDLLERLRLALLATDPAIDPELVRGETAEEVEASFAAARRMAAGIRDAVRREQTVTIPAGAPGRSAAGPSSAYDKIRAGLARLSQG